MLFPAAHGPFRRVRISLVLILFFVIAWRLWWGGFFCHHEIATSSFQPPATEVARSDAGRFCRQHGWQVFRPPSPDGSRKVYDLSMINTELDWLEIRLNTTYDYVDYFVLVEGSKTFTGLDKPLTIRDSWERLAPYQAKIIYHELEYPADFSPQRIWDREDLQRNAMFEQVLPRLTGAQAPTYGDAIVVADVDEIPRPETLMVLRTCDFPRRLTLRSRFYYYSFQFRHRGIEWAHPQATYYRGAAHTILPVNLRNGDGGLPPHIYWEKGDLWNAAWHCSSCFATIDGFLGKLSSFSHAWMNQEVFRDRHRIADRVRKGQDLWDRAGDRFDKVENNTDVPRLLLHHRAQYRYLLDRDGETAGFSDYPP